MRRPSAAALIVIIGVLVLADFVVVNDALGGIAAFAIDLAIVVAAGAGLAAVGSLAVRRGTDLWHRRGEPVGAALVLVGMAVVLVAGLRPGSSGAADPAVRWIVAALLIPIGATLFGLLFVSTVAAARRTLSSRARGGALLVGAAMLTLVLLLPIGGDVGSGLGVASGWTLDVAIGAVFRGLLVGVAILTAIFAARTMLGLGPRDE